MHCLEDKLARCRTHQKKLSERNEQARMESEKLRVEMDENGRKTEEEEAREVGENEADNTAASGRRAIVRQVCG